MISEYFNIVLSAITLSFVLSFILLGPVFFLIIETSISKGIRAALALDLGVIAADVVYIYLCYHGSKGITQYLTRHPETFAIGGLIILVFGLYQIIAKGNLHFSEDVNVGTNYISTFLKGFILNFVNIGILVFWLATVLIANTSYGYDPFKVTVFFGILLGSFFAVDILKIFLARKFKHYFTDNIIYTLKRVIGIVLALVGMYLIFQSFQEFDINKELDTHPLQQRQS